MSYWFPSTNFSLQVHCQLNDISNWIVVDIKFEHLIVFHRYADPLRASTEGILFSLSFKAQKQVYVT